MSSQAEVLRFLGRPEAYMPRPPAVERIETHASVVFLAGDFAYKVKRAVKYPFLDFSTLAKRHAAVRNELCINRRTAPQIYLEVMAVTGGDGGALALGGTGEPVEWVLRMRRFGQDGLYDRMAEEGRLDVAAMPALSAIVADFHGIADRVLTPDHAVRPLREVLADNESALTGAPDLFPPDAARAFSQASRDTLAALSPLLRKRASAGYLRHCHGDLHLRNIVEVDGAPVVFDAIEFDDQLATIDVLYDLAFLLMDLARRGLKGHANIMLNAYLDREGSTGNLAGLRALPLFLSMRAMIRAKVELLRAAKLASGGASGARDEAGAYFDLARGFLAPPPPRFIAVGGLSGSGKSAVSRALAPSIGPFPGAVHIRSDVERKRLFGAAPDERLPRQAYAPEVSDEVYAICRKRAQLAVEAGHAVILDAVHARPDERASAASVAAETGVAFTGLWLEAPAAVMRERVAKRVGDVSDATPSVVEEQLAYEIGPHSFTVIDATRPVEEVAAACLDVLRRH